MIKGNLGQIVTSIIFASSVIANAHADIAIAGKSFCEGAPEPGGAECVLKWEFEADSLAPSTVDIEYYDTKEEKWETVPGYKNIDANKKLSEPLESLALYRVVACEGAKGCYSTTATWAIVQPATVEEIPEYFDSPSGRRWFVGKSHDFLGQHQLYNLYLLNAFFLEIEAKEQLIPMTKPLVKMDNLANPGITPGQIHTFLTHKWYEEWRDRDGYNAWINAWWPNWSNEMMGRRK